MADLTNGFSRRQFITNASWFGAFYAVAKFIPLPALAAELASDSRVSQTPLVDKGFASVRKIGSGLYATISDTSEEAQHRYVVPDKFKNFPIWAWGFAIGSAIANLYAEWKAGKS